MKERFLYLCKYYILLLCIFCIEKPLFMAIDKPDDASLSASDYIKVMLNGLKLDSTVAGYLIVIPLIVIIASAWTSLRLRRILKWYYIFTAIIMASAFAADLALYPFWNFKLDATIFFYIDSPKNAAASVSVLFLIGYIAVAIALIWAFWRLQCLVTPKEIKPIGTTRKKIVCFSAGILLIVPLFITIRGGISESTSNVGRVYFSEYEYLNHSAVNPIFSFLASLGKNEDFASQFDFLPEDERKQTFGSLFAELPAEQDTVLTTNRPDVLIIIMEGFGSYMVDKLGGFEGVSPNLCRLADEGVWFSNCYASSFRTDRGVVATLSGYLAQPTTSIMKMPEKCGHLPSIAKSLKAEGYSTHFLYGGDINFTNMQGYLHSTGYQNITSDKDFSLSEQHSNAWGVQDEFTCNRAFDEIGKLKSPWLYTYLTLSSHEPFEVPFKAFDNNVLNSFAYTDHCLGKLIERLKQTKAWDNMLVVLIPDHNIRFWGDKGSTEMGVPDFHHIPMIWTGGAVKKHMTVEKIMAQTDLAATVLAQMNIRHDDFTFSRNVFSKGYNNDFAFGSYNNAFVFRDSTGCTIFDNNANKSIYGANAVREKKGKAILQTLYDDLAER